MRIERITGLPENFGEFVDEIAAGLGSLYGGEAGEAYRRTAGRNLQAALSLSTVRGYAALDGNDAAAIVTTLERGAVGHVSFIHVLDRYVSERALQPIIEKAVADLRDSGADGITSECVPLCKIDQKPVFASLGFDHIPRMLMAIDLEGPALRAIAAASQPCAEDRFDEAGRVVADAYTDHPGRWLHAEVRTPAEAAVFVRTVANGGFGLTRPEYIRLAEGPNGGEGVVIGSEISPGWGFVIQVAVCRANRGSGLGTALLNDLAAAFREAGMGHMGLGVTRDNPARRLYERLGFCTLCGVDAFVWWR